MEVNEKWWKIPWKWNWINENDAIEKSFRFSLLRSLNFHDDSSRRWLLRNLKWTNEIISEWKETQSTRRRYQFDVIEYSHRQRTHDIIQVWYSISSSLQFPFHASIILFILSLFSILMRNQRNNCWCGFAFQLSSQISAQVKVDIFISKQLNGWLRLVFFGFLG